MTKTLPELKAFKRAPSLGLSQWENGNLTTNLAEKKDTNGAFFLVEAMLAPGTEPPPHVHTREDEAYFVISGELEAIVGDEVFTLRAGETLIAPRNIPHQLRNSGSVANHYLITFSPAGFEEFLIATSVPAPDDAVAPTEPPQLPFAMYLSLLPTMEFASRIDAGEIERR
jgi:mannose-6-phosphate isomerase-like protein (cupin superfamily)